MNRKIQVGKKLLKMLAQSEDDVARGRVIRQKDLFDSLEHELTRFERPKSC